MAQFARPAADVALGSWSAIPGPELFSALNEEVADDTTLIQCSPTANDSCEIRLDEVTPGLINRGHILRYRASKGTAGGNSRGLTVDLLQGSTVIATNDHPDLSTIWLPGLITLAPEQGTLITDYADLRVRFTATGVVSGTAIQRRRVQVSWVQFRVPDWQPTWDNDWGAVEDTRTPGTIKLALEEIEVEGTYREEARLRLTEAMRAKYEPQPTMDPELGEQPPDYGNAVPEYFLWGDGRWNMAYYQKKIIDYQEFRQTVIDDPVKVAIVDEKLARFHSIVDELQAAE
jgi:hypothetical protein